jgi:Flp pilus assembly protein TadD
VSYVVRKGGERIPLDRAAVVARLRARTLSGLDWVSVGEEPAVPLASHPDFRAFFLPGSPEDLGGAPPPAPRAPSRAGPMLRRMAIGLVGLGAVGGVVFGVTTGLIPIPELHSAPAPVAAPAPTKGSATDAAKPAPAPAPAADGPMAALKKRVGEVDEPRTLLLARAWESRLDGSRKGLDAAITSAERAVVRAPDDPEALALLAELYGEAGREPELREALLKKAEKLGPNLPAVVRAMALSEIAEGLDTDARALADGCLKSAPDDLGCREALLRSTEGTGDVANTLYAYDELAKRWPANKHLPCRAAVVAARNDVARAEERVAAARKLVPDDRDVLAAAALLDFRNGDFDEAVAIAKGFGKDVPVDVALDAAALAVARGDSAGALQWLAATEGAKDGKDRAKLLTVQAKLVAAMGGDAAAVKAASAAAAQLDAANKTDPAGIEARGMAAALASDAQGAARAWSLLDGNEEPGVARSRALLARARSEIASGHAPDAIRSTERAIAADPVDPDAHLWHLYALLAVQNAPGLRLALDQAVLDVDGSADRRTPLAPGLRVPPPGSDIAAALAKAAEGVPDIQNDQAWIRAVIAFLEGDAATAGASLDGDAHPGLAARLALARDDGAAALDAADRAAARQPGETGWQLARARALALLGRWKEADAALTIVRSGHPTGAGVHMVRAAIAKSKANTASVLEAAQAAVDADPWDLSARRLLRSVD